MNEEWLLQQIESLEAQETDYKNLALLSEMKKLIKEMDQRIELLQGEIDGRVWNPSDW
jgi:uncharacterized small protein (DUF1192 family)